MKKILALIISLALLISLCPAVIAADAEAEEAAWKLYGYGLFRGTGTDADGNPVFSLERSPNRNEAVTMLVRLLGKETEATEGEWETPFTDMDNWAVPYIGYAYASKLTNGTGKTTYSGKNSVSAAQYITFVLRALGYSSDTDFKWNEPWLLSDEIGLTDGRYNEGTETFTRGDAAIVSAAALDVKLKGTDMTLLESLIESGAVRDPDDGVSEIYEQAMDAFDDERYEESVGLFKQAAEAGDLNSMIQLGYMYYMGYGTEPDFAESLYWYAMAAENGDIECIEYVSDCYYRGDIVEQDRAKAFEWSMKGAELGSARSQFYVGYMYSEGIGVEQDYEKALEYYWLAAQQGNIDAINSVGYMYYYGLGVEQSYEMAFDWQLRAAELGNSIAMHNVGNAYEYGEGVPQNYQLAAQWYQKSADEGNKYGQRALGRLYLDGKGVTKDQAMAVSLFRQAADQGDAQSQYWLGYCYENGFGVLYDIDEALVWYKAAADQGYGPAIEKVEKLG